MNTSYVIIEEKEIFSTINSDDEKKCAHENQTNKLEETIIQNNKEVLRITYSCTKCDIKIVTVWQKIGRFYLKED